jgi:hypothetical protein
MPPLELTLLCSLLSIIVPLILIPTVRRLGKGRETEAVSPPA